MLSHWELGTQNVDTIKVIMFIFKWTMQDLWFNYLILMSSWHKQRNMEAAMFLVVAQTGQTKHPLSFFENWRLPQVLFPVWKGRVRWWLFTWNMTLHHFMSLNSKHCNFKVKTLKIIEKCNSSHNEQALWCLWREKKLTGRNRWQNKTKFRRPSASTGLGEWR